MSDTGTIQIAVEQTLSELEIEGPRVVRLAESVELFATGLDQFGNNYPLSAVTWTSADNKIATVENGMVTGVAEGQSYSC